VVILAKEEEIMRLNPSFLFVLVLLVLLTASCTITFEPDREYFGALAESGRPRGESPVETRGPSVEIRIFNNTEIPFVLTCNSIDYSSIRPGEQRSYRVQYTVLRPQTDSAQVSVVCSVSHFDSENNFIFGDQASFMVKAYNPDPVNLEIAIQRQGVVLSRARTIR
jgi:hypothetical protein